MWLDLRVIHEVGTTAGLGEEGLRFFGYNIGRVDMWHPYYTLHTPCRVHLILLVGSEKWHFWGERVHLFSCVNLASIAVGVRVAILVRGEVFVFYFKFFAALRSEFIKEFQALLTIFIELSLLITLSIVLVFIGGPNCLKFDEIPICLDLSWEEILPLLWIGKVVRVKARYRASELWSLASALRIGWQRVILCLLHV